MDYNKRDKILGIDNYNYSCGIYRMTFDTEKVDQLLELGFIDPDGRQNDSPRAQTMVDFVHDNPKFKLHGYVVSGVRSDARISFEGVVAQEPLTDKERADFLYVFRRADDLQMIENYTMAWYD